MYYVYVLLVCYSRYRVYVMLYDRYDSIDPNLGMHDCVQQCIFFVHNTGVCSMCVNCFYFIYVERLRGVSSFARVIVSRNGNLYLFTNLHYFYSRQSGNYHILLYDTSPKIKTETQLCYPS